jgi:sphingomyelin phosphodiesterase acid-like 3
MQNTRLIVLQDIFESRRYSACSAGENTSAAEQQIAWLKGQLADARDHNQAVWVMAHIPPGVDVYSTLTKGTDVCTGKAPDLFLSSDALTQTLVEFPWTVHLVLLAHSHMDEMRLFHSGDLSGANGRHSSHIPGAVPGKLVPSISPINGNSPAFTVAQVDPHSATLVDYAVYVASNTTGLDAHWPEEYRYSTTYHEPDFSAASVSRLVLTMRDDKTAADPATGSYAHWFWAGDSGVHALALRLVWPAYSCAMTETTEAGYRSCVCPAGSSSPAKGPAAKEPVTAPSPTPQDAGKPTPQR